MSFLFGQAPDPKGNWKLSGLSVDYLHIARETTPFLLTVDYPGTGTAFSSSSDCAIRVTNPGCAEEGATEACIPTDDTGTLVVNPNPTSICFHLLDIPSGVMFNRLTNGPFTNTGLAGIGVNLNVNIYDNGYGTIAQGSFYPDIELSESQDCVTDLQIFAVDENFTWEIGTEELSFSNSNVLGMDNGLLCVGDDPDTIGTECTNDSDGDGLNDDAAWGFGLVTGLFDATPATPVPVRVPPVLNAVALSATEVLGLSCGAWCAGPSMDGSDGGAQGFGGNVTLCAETCAEWDYDTAAIYGASSGNVPGWLENGTGTSSKFNTNTGPSTMCTDNDGNSIPGDGTCNPNVDFRLVWNALDSDETGLGFGDDPDVDEDGDGTDYDRIFGVPYLAGTTLNTSNPLCDITGGTAKYLTPGTDMTGDERYSFNYGLAGDIVSTLGDAGCGEDYDMTDSSTYCCSSGDHPFYSISGTNSTSVSAVYACGEATVAGFITGNCNVATSDGIVDACSDTSTGAGTPALFATGFCGQQIQSNLASCSAAGWQTIVGGVCSGLGVDCSSDLGAAQVMFDQVCVGAALQAGLPAGQVSTCAELATATGQSQNDIECGFLADDFLIDADGDGTNDTPFYLGACNTVAGGVVANSEGGDNCTDWVATFTQDAIDTFATGNIGTSCTAYGDNFTNDCLETAGDPNSENLTEMYLLNPSSVPAQYGFFATYNAVNFGPLAASAGAGSPIPCDPTVSGTVELVAFPGTHPIGGAGYTDWDGDGDGPDADDIAAFTGYCNPLLTVNDSDHDFDPMCLADCDATNSLTCTYDCSGRLRTTFEPTCVREI
ncbi:MAG: hypothetical protein CMG50_04505, partial [Candidatus Marinimicrobia bacterium]|nr:hypothetical protein [Candidatus Neomarinimicrobiota bacterium]